MVLLSFKFVSRVSNNTAFDFKNNFNSFNVGQFCFDFCSCYSRVVYESNLLGIKNIITISSPSSDLIAFVMPSNNLHMSKADPFVIEGSSTRTFK